MTDDRTPRPAGRFWWLLTATSTLLGVIVIVLYAIPYASRKDYLSILATALSLAGASGFVGGLVGFLFGIPRAPEEHNPSGYRPNTNLEQISDWLTKVLLGVGLAEIGQVALIGEYFGDALGDTIIGSRFAIGISILFTLTGFFHGYLWARVRLPFLFRDVDTRARDAAQRANRELERVFQDLDLLDKREEPTDAPGVKQLASLAARVDASQIAPDVARTMGLSLYNQRKYGEAIPFLRTATARFGDDVEVAMKFAFALGEVERRSEAADVLQALERARMGIPAVYKLLGYYLLWLPTKLEQALEYSTRYLKHVPDDAGALMNAACAHAQLHDRNNRQGEHGRLAQHQLARAIRQAPALKAQAERLRNDDFRSLTPEEFQAALEGRELEKKT